MLSETMKFKDDTKILNALKRKLERNIIKEQKWKLLMI